MNELAEIYARALAAVFGRTVGLPVTAGGPVAGRGADPAHDVSAIIEVDGLGPPVGRGALVLSFPADVARRAVGRVLGADAPPELAADVADGVGEIANIVAGAAKAGLAVLGIGDCDTSLPTVVLGAQHEVFRRRNARCCAVRFRSGVGPFLLQLVSLRERARTSRPAARRDEGGIG